MVRVPGSLGDSGFHRESAEDVQVKKESGEEASSEHGSTKTLLNETRSAARQSTGRNSVDGNEGDLETDQEDKPQLPPQVPSGTPVGLDESRDSLTKQTKAGSDRYTFSDSPIKLEPGSDQHDFSKTAQGAATPRRKMKGPDLEEGDKKGSDSRWSDVALEFAYNRQEMQKFIDRDPVLQILRPKQISMPKGPIVAPTISDNKLDLIKGLMNLLKEAGLVASPFDANELFDLDLKVIQSSIKTVIIELKALVGEIPSYRHPTVPDPVSSPQIGSTRYQTALPYLSAAAPGSDGSSEPQRMPRRLPGAAMLESRSDTLRQERPRSRSRKPRPTPTDRTVRTTRSEESTSRFECHFQTAMSRFLKEQHQATAPSAAVKAIQYVESHDVEMKSTGSRDPDPSCWEYDPDEIDRPIPARTAVATTTTGPPASSTIQQIRISAISDLKEFTGRDQDEDRARSWISKVKSALLRDRATDEEKCLIFADLLTGPAKNWYRQLSRSTRNKWSDLLRNFQIQYCGLGLSRIWQYYQSRKKSDESPLEYLYRLNVAALRARLKIKDGNPKTRREHVEHFIATLGNPDLADQLTLLRLADADDLEEVLRARERAKISHSRSAFGSKYPQEVLSLAPTTSIKRPVYAVQIATRESESDTESDGSDSEGDLRRMYLASAYKKSYDTGGGPTASDQVRHGQIGYNPPQSNHQSSTQHDGSDRSSRCSHCGSRKHTDRDCWKRLTCQQCGKTGHPTDHCLFVCRGCGELHDMGRCPMEEFYSQIRRWYNPAKHAGMLPAVAEKMLKLGRSPGWNPVRAERSRYCIYAFVNKNNADRLRRKADLRSNTCDQPARTAAAIMSLQRSNEFSRSDAEVPIDLHSGESRGYWKQLRPEEWFKPANSEVTTEIVIPDRNLPRVSEHRRSGTVMSDLLPGESRGYWKQGHRQNQQ